MEGNSTTPKNCVLTEFLHERSTIFLLVFSLIRFWILLRNGFSFQFLISKFQGSEWYTTLKFCHKVVEFSSRFSHYCDFEFCSGMSFWHLRTKSALIYSKWLIQRLNIPHFKAFGMMHFKYERRICLKNCSKGAMK